MIGLWAYTLLFVQIIIGAFMDRWIEKYGPWVLKFHVFEGILIYTLIIIHPLLFTVFYYLVGRGFDPFYAYLDVCVLCDGLTEYYYNFGRVGIWFLTIGVFAGLFRTVNPFMRMHWRKFHILNYVAFLLIFIHSLTLGTDVGTSPFQLLHLPSGVVILAVIIWKVKGLYQQSISKDMRK
jgi:predicted ferric reductase